MTRPITKQRFQLDTLPGTSLALFGSLANGEVREGSVAVGSMQMIESESHPDFLSGITSRDTGGPFRNRKVQMELLGGYRVRSHVGPYDTHTNLIPDDDIAAFFNTYHFGRNGSPEGRASWLESTATPGLSDQELNALGTKAIDITKPTNPTVDIAVSIGELLSERKFFAAPGSSGSLAGEYLNYSFGIAPTIADFQDLRTAIEKTDKLIRQYEKDAGKHVRRRFEFDTEKSVTTSSYRAYPQTAGIGLNTYQVEQGLVTKTVQKSTRSWFSGAFKYSIPKDAFPKRIAELDHLYGIVPGLSLGWELVPFSWLVDYFTPLGSLFDNIDAFLKDGLVIPYAYIMSETKEVSEHTWEGQIQVSDGAWERKTVTGRITKTTQRRLPASPFGFGILPGGLNAHQISILAALGLTMRK